MYNDIIARNNASTEIINAPIHKYTLFDGVELVVRSLLDRKLAINSE